MIPRIRMHMQVRHRQDPGDLLPTLINLVRGAVHLRGLLARGANPHLLRGGVLFGSSPPPPSDGVENEGEKDDDAVEHNNKAVRDLPVSTVLTRMNGSSPQRRRQSLAEK